MFLPLPPRREPEPVPDESRPPEVVVDASGAEVRFKGIRYWRMEWVQVREVAVDVIDYGDGSAEGFWHLSGDGTELDVPVEIVMGSDEFNALMFALPGFDMAAYRRAREAEAAAKAGYFVCWRSGPA
ncbi:MAG TPA: hypothetical protein VKI65_19695 [Gemmataceae bacterium]|nr:hypothetical protein [Gemmataceae bacterium]